MLFRVVALVSVVALALALAACAEQGEAMAAETAAEAAQIAATQAEIATTQAISDLEASTTRMAKANVRTGGPRGIPILSKLPKHKGNYIIFTKHWIIMQKGDRRLIVHREDYEAEEGLKGDVNPYQ